MLRLVAVDAEVVVVVVALKVVEQEGSTQRGVGCGSSLCVAFVWQAEADFFLLAIFTLTTLVSNNQFTVAYSCVSVCSCVCVWNCVCVYGTVCV